MLALPLALLGQTCDLCPPPDPPHNEVFLWVSLGLIGAVALCSFGWRRARVAVGA